MIPHIKIKYKPLHADIPAYERAVADHIRHVINDSAIALLRVIARKVPVYAGEARASFLPLAHKVGFNLEVIPSAGAAERGRNTIAIGMRLGFAHLPHPTSTRTFKFEWRSDSYHLFMNDSFSMQKHFRNEHQRQPSVMARMRRKLGRSYPLATPSAYNAISEARAAFISHFNANIGYRFPNISRFIVV